MPRPQPKAFTLIELVVVVLVIAVIIGMLLPAVQQARKASVARKLANESQYGFAAQMAQSNLAQAGIEPGKQPPPRPRAHVKSFAAEVTLTPKLSKGTATPESIYEARFESRIDAMRSQKEDAEHELELPLPPQVISLADLSVTAGSQPSEMVAIRDGKMIWRGKLTAEPMKLEVKYTAVGKGLYELSVPPGGILERFEIMLTARDSDVNLLELSLQPTSLARSPLGMTYTWNYQRLLFGQPVRLDVLGVAPIDRLGELTWLAPISVAVFGILVGLVVRAAQATLFDRWMLFLTVGAFAGAYPLMYFAQEYISLTNAVMVSAGVSLAIIFIRAATLMGFALALFGVLVPAAAIMALTLAAAVWPRLQGLLLTVEALGFFIVAMMLVPRLKLTPEMALINQMTAAAAPPTGKPENPTT